MSKKKDTYNQTAIRTSIGGQALIEGIMMRETEADCDGGAQYQR